MVKRFLHRHEPKDSHARWLKAGIGSLLGIGFIAWLSHTTQEPLLMAPFGATAVLLFSVPGSPLSQPANVVGGHLLAAALSLGLFSALPHEWWAVGVVVGVVVAVMAMFRLTHPPAGANPIVIFLSQPGFEFLFIPVVVGSATLVAIALLVHQIPPRTVAYPLPHPEQK